MSLSRAGYLMQTPISSIHKNVDRIIHYANVQTPWRLLGTLRMKLCQTFSMCVFLQAWNNLNGWIKLWCFQPHNLTLFLFFFLCRFWIWEFLSAREASGHMVRQPTVCCSRGLWGSAVWGPTAGHLGKTSMRHTFGFGCIHPYGVGASCCCSCDVCSPTHQI